MLQVGLPVVMCICERGTDDILVVGLVVPWLFLLFQTLAGITPLDRYSAHHSLPFILDGPDGAPTLS